MIGWFEIDIDLDSNLFILFVIFGMIEAIIFIFNDIRIIVVISFLFVVDFETDVDFGEGVVETHGTGSF
jgi:hypothetical protein